MGYIERILGDTERVLYRTHQHWIVVLQRIVGWLLIFAVFLGLGLAVITPKLDDAGDRIRWIVGLIVVCFVAVPLFLIIRAWVRRDPERSFLRVIWRPALSGLFAAALGVLLMLQPSFWRVGFVGVVLAAIPLGAMIRIFLDWLNERYLITTRRVMEIHGIVNKHVRDSALEKVNDVDMNQSFFGRLLNYGTVQIITGSDIGINKFHRILNPVPFKRAMLNAKEQLHQGSPSIAAEEGFGPTAAQAGATAADAQTGAGAVAALTAAITSADIPDIIKDLDALRQKGIISEEEFQAKKQELLGRL